MSDSHNRGFDTIRVIFYTLFTFAPLASAGTYSGGRKINPGVPIKGLTHLIG